MSRFGRMRAAIWLASSLVCLPLLAHPASAAPKRIGSPDKSAAKPQSAKNAWQWLKSKAGSGLPRKTAPQPAAPAEVAAPQTRAAAGGASMAHLQWSFDEVEASVVADKLANYGFSLPFKVEGILSLHVDIGVPWRSPLTSEEYDLKGDLQAARLVVAGVELRNVKGQWEYAQGLLTLEHLKLELPAPGKPNGVFVGAVEMKLSPPGDATARFSFAQLEISALSKLAPEWAGIASGQASGRAEARAPVAHIEDPATWRARANAEFEELKGLGLPAARLSAEFQLAAGVVHASKVKAETDHTHVAGAGQFGLSAPYAYSASLRISAGKLSHLNGLHPDFKLPLEISGRVGASAKLNGSLEPREFSLVGGVNARDLRVAGVKLDEMKFTFDVTHDRLHLHPLSASLYGGSADLSLAMALTPDGEIKTGLRWRKVRIDQLAADAGNAAESLRGAAAGGALQLRAPAARYTDPTAWHAHGTVDLEHPLAGAQSTVKTAANIHLASGVLRLDDFDVSLGQNRLAGSLELKLVEPFAYRLALKQAQLDLGVVEKLLLSKMVGAARPLAGELTMAADLHGTLSPLAILGRGELLARRVRAGGAELESLSSQFTAEEDRVKIESIQAAGYGGQLTGSLTFELAEQGATQAIVNWRRIDAGKLINQLRLSPAPLSAVAGGSFRGEAPTKRLFESAAWGGETAMTIDRLAIVGLPETRVELRAKLADRKLEVSRFVATQAKAQGQKPASLAATGRIELDAPFAFQANVSLGEFDLAQLSGLPSPLRLPLELAGLIGAKGEIAGALAPLAVTAQGAANCSGLKLNAAKVDSLRFQFQLDEKLLSLDEIDAALDDGVAAGAVRLPLAEDAAGEIKLSLKQVDLLKLLSGAVRLPVRLAGRIDADVDAKIPPGALAQPQEWIVAAKVDAEQLRANSTPLGHIHARLKSHEELLQYEATGEALEGTIEVSGDWRLPDNQHPGGVNRGHIKLHGIELDAVGDLLRSRGLVESLSGTVNAEFDYRHDERTGLPVGDGLVEFDDIRHNGDRLADRLRGKLRLEADRLELKQVSGELAGGELLAEGVIRLSSAERGALEVQLVGADLRRLLFAWPQLAQHQYGAADLDLRMFHGAAAPWEIYGSATLRHGEIAEVVFRNIHLPIEANYDPLSGQRCIRMRNVVVEMASGRITGDLFVLADNQLQIEGKARLTNVHLQEVFCRSAHTPHLAGKVTGTLAINGRSVRSLRDLNGSFQAKLRNIHGVPGAHHAGNHTSGAVSAGTRFDEGELRGAISRGVVRLERFSLEGNKTQVYATGQAALGGRLDLDVTVNTGVLDRTSQTLVSLIGQLSLFVVPEVTLLLELNQFLSNQVVHLKVTGSTRSPTVRVRPLPLLGEEALRFFLLQGPPEP